MGKLLFMESLVTGWKMLWENGGKEVSLFHDFSMHYPRGYQLLTKDGQYFVEYIVEYFDVKSILFEVNFF